jgi:diguanylate cyclase (GGDEF)-like protein
MDARGGGRVPREHRLSARALDLDLVQVLDGLGHGVVVLDPECRIGYWNRWMERASGLTATEAAGKSLPELYPGLDTAAFRRNLKSVLAFGIVAYFSQRVHGQLFPFPPAPGSPEGFELMQQHCVMGPLREGGEIVAVYLTVEDVTEAVSYQRRLAELAMRDVLTSAFNRRFFDRRFGEELQRARRYRHSLGLVMIDIDHFKAVNDGFGHQFGDEALKSVAAVCGASVRASDILARYGGEEFCLLLPETGIEEAAALAERVRSAVERSPVRAFGRCADLTISAGVAGSREEDATDDLLRRADEALYAAKNGGRNKVEVSA